MLTFHSKKGNDLFILKYDGAAVPSATPEGLNLCNPRSDRNGSGGRHLGEKWRSAVVAARDGVRRRTKRAVAAYRGNKCKSEANSDLRAMLCGTAAAIGAHLLACGWGTGVFYMEANLCKSETNYAPDGALWVGSKLGQKARRHRVGLRVGGAGPPKS